MSRLSSSDAREPSGERRETQSILTDRGTITAPLVVDALGWKRVLAGNEYQPPDAPLSRGLEVHPHGARDSLEIWIDRGYVPAGYGWSFPAGGMSLLIVCTRESVDRTMNSSMPPGLARLKPYMLCTWHMW